MENKIHPTAIVDSTARIGQNVQIGAYTTIEKNVTIGDNTWIGQGAYIDENTVIGKECKIFHHACLGTPPQDLKFKGEDTFLEIGDHTVIREFADLNRGTSALGKTSVGKNCLIMAYVHIAHDCIIGDRVIMSNAINLAGHVEIEHDATVGGMCPVHQFVKIGAYSMVGGGLRVAKDVPPYILSGDEPLRYKGLNIIKLQRMNFDPERIAAIKKAYRILYQSKLSVSQAVDEIKNQLDCSQPDVKNALDFVENSERGIIPGFRKK